MSVPHDRRHVLVLNDSDDVLRLMHDLLEDEGYRVTTQFYLSRDIQAVIDLKPDALVLDYMWAHQDDSWSFLQMLKMSPKTQNIPIVLCTGAIRQVEELKGHLDEMGVRVVLKPFDIDVLAHEIAMCLGDSATDPS